MGQSKSNFIWSPHGMGEWKFVQMVQVTWTKWLPCPYMVKTLKIFFSGTKSLMTLKLGVQHRVLEYYQIYLNDDPELTLTYFMARSNLVPYDFVWEKRKTMDFSETMVVYYLKLATDDEVTRSFCWHQNFVPWGLYAMPRCYIHVLNHEKNCIKSDFKEISLKLATNG